MGANPNYSRNLNSVLNRPYK